MGRKITEIEGIGEATAEKLQAAGIVTVEDLLSMGAEAKGRADIASKSGLTEHKVLYLVGMADLIRINGIGGEFAELLKASGVDTVKELATRNAANLHAKITEVNAEKKLVRQLPSEGQIEKFIDEAKNTASTITH
jgi:predicted flap endonuclease-1-like 5' DNA nuclease